MQTAQRQATARGGSARNALTFDSWTIVLGFFGAGNVANGIWMLIDPAHWYENLPAAVPDFGPLNEHFVRDIGCAFLIFGLGVAVSAVVARWRVAACAALASFAVLHALVHVLDTARGAVSAAHWWIDLPGVYIPALLLVVMTALLARRAGAD